MIYVILLLILAVLLFGSSVVTGFLGVVLGFIVAVIALFTASVYFDISTETWILIGLGFVALIGVANYVLNPKGERDDKAMKPQPPAPKR